ncbi:cation transporter [Nanoarchaeota archaeon]
MKKRIYCPDIECDSCLKVLEKVFSKLQGVKKHEIKDNYVDVEFNETLIKAKTIIQAIKDKGYRASLEPYTRKKIGERGKEFLKDKKKYQIEYMMLRNIGITFLVLLLLDALLIYLKSTADPTFIGNYAWWIFYLTLSVATIGGAIWHFKSYKTQYTCMVGMMIGMTLGMQTGMMIGAVLGVTNGFFTGALVGMLIASAIGAYCGQCCGIMGIMEGIMAGIMGGTMGAMITVMMFNNNILWFMPPFMILNMTILAGLSYMIFEEVVEDNKSIIKNPISFQKFLLLCLLAWGILMAIMLLTPASIFVQ